MGSKARGGDKKETLSSLTWEEEQQEMAILKYAAAATSRHFRTFLKQLTKGHHIKQAMTLVSLRDKSGRELLADDINHIIESCACAKESEMIYTIVGKWKNNGVLAEMSDEAIIEGAKRIMAEHDMGELGAIIGKRAPLIEGTTATVGSKRSREAAAIDAGTGRTDQEDAADAEVAHERAAVETGVAPMEQEEAGGAPAGGAGRPDAKVAFKHAIEILKETVGKSDGTYAPQRLKRLKRVFNDTAKTNLNARSYVLATAAAVNANDTKYARHLLSEMFERKYSSMEDLYMHMQPDFIRRLTSLGLLPDDPKTLACEPMSKKWCFLTAAAEAQKGDQFGSKHGAVLVKGDQFLAAGHNHRYAPRGHAHIRVMHAEIHTLVQLPSKEMAEGSECYIIELDWHGVGYEEAVPCPMCQTGLCSCGLSKVHYSSHAGLITEKVSHKPGLKCETYELALTRTYPEGTTPPDGAPPPVPPDAESAAPAPKKS